MVVRRFTAPALRRSALVVAFGCGVAGVAGPAWAQDTGQAGDTDQLGDTVLSREAARLREGGIKAGSFTIMPDASIMVTVDDNILADSDNPITDGIVTLRPAIAIESDWSRHALDISGNIQNITYLENSSENATEFNLLASGRIDVSRQTRISLSADYNQQAERRGDLGSFQAAAERARFSALGGSVRLNQSLGRVALQAEGRYREWSYDDVPLTSGAILDQSFRDFQVTSGSLQVGVNVSPITQIFSRFTAESRRYDLRPGDAGFDPLTFVDRSADSLRLEVGLQRQLTELLTATVRLGYLDFSYPDPKVRDFKVFAYFATVRWNPTPLTTISLASERSVDETVSPTTAGNLRDELRLSVDHELLRQLILTGRVRLGWIEPSEAPTSLVTNSSQERQLSLESRYYLFEKFRLSLNLQHTARDSSFAGLDFSANSASFQVLYSF